MLDVAGEAASSFFFIVFINFIIKNSAKAIMMNDMILDKKLPYLTAVPGIVSFERSEMLADDKAGVKINGVKISSTKEETIFPNAAPMTKPTARSITLPLRANALNSETTPIVIQKNTFL